MGMEIRLGKGIQVPMSIPGNRAERKCVGRGITSQASEYRLRTECGLYTRVMGTIDHVHDGTYSRG